MTRETMKAWMSPGVIIGIVSAVVSSAFSAGVTITVLRGSNATVALEVAKLQTTVERLTSSVQSAEILAAANRAEIAARMLSAEKAVGLVEGRLETQGARLTVMEKAIARLEAKTGG